MKPVDQTQYGTGANLEPLGDCWSACIASILELDIVEVPHFYEKWPAKNYGPDKALIEASDWLADRGYRLLPIGYIDRGAARLIKGTICIVSGISPRSGEKKVEHAVVGRIKDDGSFDILHDPHPSRDGVVKITGFEIIIKMDPTN